VTFGLLQVGSKLSGAAAGLAFGVLYLASGHPRAGLAALVLQILAGWWALGRRTAAYRPRTSRIE
jgi:hypothetical protein